MTNNSEPSTVKRSYSYSARTCVETEAKVTAMKVVHNKACDLIVHVFLRERKAGRGRREHTEKDALSSLLSPSQYVYSLPFLPAS